MKFMISVAEIEIINNDDNRVIDWEEEIYYGTLEDAIRYSKEFMCHSMYANYEIEVHRIYNPQLMVLVHQELF